MTDNAEEKIPPWHSLLAGTSEQIEAITSDKPLTVVSAGAGTGKTYTLAQRFAWLLSADKDCAVDQILVLTFTEKAALEMQERIKKTVGDWYCRYPKDLSHLGRSVRFIDDAYISTIHSFSMKVIRESGLVLNIDPAAGIAPGPKEYIWWDDFAAALGDASASRLLPLLSGIWQERADEIFNDEFFIDFVNSYGPAMLAQTAKKASDILGGSGKDPEFLWSFSGEALACSIESMAYYARSVWELWHEKVFPDINDILSDNPGKSFEELKSIAAVWKNSDPGEDDLKKFTQELLYKGLAKLPGNSKLKSTIEKSLGIGLKEWRDTAKLCLFKSSCPSEQEKAVTSFLNRISAIGWHCWESLKQKEDILSMSDLVHYACKVVGSSEGYCRKFKHILIDEFQDTDPLQDNLISSLWVKPDGAEEHFHNTLFIVGDLKQSIYRFRHADLRLFSKYIAMCGDRKENDVCKYVMLNRSFRSRMSILEGVNTVFGNLWSEGMGGIRVPYEPLCGADEAEWWNDRNNEEITPAIESLVSVIGIIQDDKGNGTPKTEKISDARARLYAELGRKIIEIKTSGRKIWNKSEKKFDEVKWMDFAVLVPTRTVYPEIEKAFDASGIPYVLCTNRSYFARGEIGDLVNLISLLADPSDPLCLAGWLASPFSGTEPGTAELCMAEAETAKSKGCALPLSEIIIKKLPDVWRKIIYLRNKAIYSGVSSVILDIMKTPSFLGAYGPEHRNRVVANIIKLSDIAEEYESSEGRSLYGCAAYMQSAVSSMQQKEEPDVTSSEQDAVKVMTIHSSKGLEFPIVALSGAEDGGYKSDSICVSCKYGVIAKKIPDFLCNGTGKVPTVSGVWFDEEEKQAAEAEKERLWYVGVTRAMDKLILCGTMKAEKDEEIHAGSFIERVVSVNKDNRAVSYLECGQVKKDTEKFHIRSEAAETAPLGLITVSPPKLARISASAFAMLSWCPAAYRISYRQGRTMEWLADAGEDGRGGSGFGTLAHWILARWDFKSETLDKWLPESGSQECDVLLRKIPSEIRSEFRSDKNRDELKRMLSGYAATEEGGYLAYLASGRSSSRLYRETPFRVQDEDLLLVGATDVFWEDTDGVHLIDWKTTPESYAPARYYEYQLMFYGYAVWRYRGQKNYPEVPVRLSINYLRSGSLPEKGEIIFDGKMSDKYRIKIHSAAEAALSEKFVRNNENCILCPWKDFCINNKSFFSNDA